MSSPAVEGKVVISYGETAAFQIQIHQASLNSLWQQTYGWADWASVPNSCSIADNTVLNDQVIIKYKNLNGVVLFNSFTT